MLFCQEHALYCPVYSSPHSFRRPCISFHDTLVKDQLLAVREFFKHSIEVTTLFFAQCYFYQLHLAVFKSLLYTVELCLNFLQFRSASHSLFCLTSFVFSLVCCQPTFCTPRGKAKRFRKSIKFVQLPL